MKAGVVAFAFGANWDICSNLRIAEIAREKELRLRSNGASVSIFTQYDVCLEGADHASENDHDPPPTLRIAREAIRWAKERGLKELWIVAAKPHLWRACRDMKASLRSRRRHRDLCLQKSTNFRKTRGGSAVLLRKPEPGLEGRGTGGGKDPRTDALLPLRTRRAMTEKPPSESPWFYHSGLFFHFKSPMEKIAAAVSSTSDGKYGTIGCNGEK